MTHRDYDFERAVHGVVQGVPGAFQVLHGLHETFEFEDYQAMVCFLYERGPRGSRLWERYRERCGEDSFVLGKDLLAQLTEWSGWERDGDCETETV